MMRKVYRFTTLAAVSLVALLPYTCLVLSQQKALNVCKTISGGVPDAPCILPFTYMNHTYQHCTQEDHHLHWCATDVDKAGKYVEGKWGNCNNKTCTITDEIVCKTESGNVPSAPCVFPFTYRNSTFQHCTQQDHTMHWCATAVDKAGKFVEGNWGNCNKKTCTITAVTVCKTTSGKVLNAPCVFPFTYNNIIHQNCTQQGHHLHWCATEVDQAGKYVEGQWGNCDKQTCIMANNEGVCKTISGDMPNTPCVFPFEYKNVSHSQCITRGFYNPWCATRVDNGNKFVIGEWGNCNTTTCPHNEESCKTISGDKPNTLCVFPFKYKNISYSQCTTQGFHKPWCATKVDNERKYVKGEWGNCNTTTCPFCKTTSGGVANASCIFPFTYNNHTYQHCTQHNHDSHWCVTEVDQDGNYVEGNWGNCNNNCTHETYPAVDLTPRKNTQTPKQTGVSLEVICISVVLAVGLVAGILLFITKWNRRGNCRVYIDDGATEMILPAQGSDEDLIGDIGGENVLDIPM